jgi:hypothetical protein
MDCVQQLSTLIGILSDSKRMWLVPSVRTRLAQALSLLLNCTYSGPLTTTYRCG